jgi:hypothetical protein
MILCRKKWWPPCINAIAYCSSILNRFEYKRAYFRSLNTSRSRLMKASDHPFDDRVQGHLVPVNATFRACSGQFVKLTTL